MRNEFDADMRAPSPSLRLASHVRACLLDQEVILLDLLCSRYIGLPAVPGFEHHVSGWPLHAEPAASLELRSSIDALVRRLRSAKLISASDDESDSPPAGATVLPPLRSLDAGDIVQARPTIRLTARFLKAALLASASLRFRTMQAIVRAADTRRARVRSRGAQPDDSIATIVATYELLRPLLFTVRDKCLFDSLALHYFLIASGIHPTWIIGVKSRPFGAHSWLQLGHVVVNDQVERVVQFKPILAV